MEDTFIEFEHTVINIEGTVIAIEDNVVGIEDTVIDIVDTCRYRRHFCRIIYFFVYCNASGWKISKL